MRVEYDAHQRGGAPAQKKPRELCSQSETRTLVNAGSPSTLSDASIQQYTTESTHAQI